MSAVPISVVVPARGNEAQLRLCLEALSSCEPRAAEVLVVDDASPAPLLPMLAAWDVVPMRRDSQGGPGAARNDGVARARHDVVLFIDSDVVVKKDTIGKVAAVMFRADAPAAVFGSYDDTPGAPTFIAQYRNLLHHFIHQGSERKALTFWAGCGAIAKAAFHAVGGFDVARFTRPSVEDIDLGYRLTDRGFPIELDRGIVVSHLKEWTFVETIRVDVFKRAAPWTRLMLERGSVPPDLNLKPHHRVSGALVLLLVVLLLAWPLVGGRVIPLLALLCAVALLVLNRDFYGFLARARGAVFAARAVPLHWLYYLYSALTFGVVNVSFRLGRLLRSR